MVKPYYDKNGITIYCGDCLDVLPCIKRADYDLITDPPYGLGKRWKRKTHGSNGQSKLWTGEIPDWDNELPQDRLDLALSMCDKWIIWGGYRAKLPAGTGVLVWDKVQKTKQSEGEAALTNAANGVSFFRMTRIDAYKNKAIFSKGHPCEKPIQLMSWCLNLVRADSTILDPFMGSGTLAYACSLSRRKFVGIEKELKYCDLAISRLERTAERVH